MNGNRVKVLSPFDSRGTVVFHAFVGSLYQVFSAVAGLFLSWTPYFRVGRSALMLGALVIAFTMAAWLTARCQSRRLSFCAGFAFGFAWFFTWICTTVFRTRFWLSINSWMDMAASLIWIGVAVVVATICGCLYFAVNLIFRTFLYEIVIQDGTLCWKCAYRVGNPPISDRCSECGTPIHPPVVRLGPGVVRRWFKRHAWLMASSAVALATMFAVYRIAEHIRAASALRTSLAGTAATGAIMKIGRMSGGATWIDGEATAGVWRPIPTDASKVMFVLYDPRPRSGFPVMQIQLMGLGSGRWGTQPQWGNPAISCDLSPVQAAYVLEHDVPQSLIDAMLQEATDAKWVPMPNGGMVNCIEVPPDGHFP